MPNQLTFKASGGTSLLSSLSDVSLSALALNNRLTYNGTVWINEYLPPMARLSLSDVITATKVGLSIASYSLIDFSTNTSGVTVTIQNLADGVVGRTIDIVKTTGTASTTLIIKNGNSSGGQPIYLLGLADVTITSYASGVRLIYNGGAWYEIRR